MPELPDVMVYVEALEKRVDELESEREMDKLIHMSHGTPYEGNVTTIMVNYWGAIRLAAVQPNRKNRRELEKAKWMVVQID